MAEYEIIEPHPKSTIDELARTWDDLIRIDRLDPTLLGEVFASFSAQDPPSTMGPCPYKEDTPEYLDWCANRYAQMIAYAPTPSKSDGEEIDIDWDAIEAQTPSSGRIMRPRRK